jgi:hypothetical protein
MRASVSSRPVHDGVASDEQIIAVPLWIKSWLNHLAAAIIAFRKVPLGINIIYG